MARRLDLPTKRFSLSAVGDGWDDCYVEYQPLTPRDLLVLADVDVEQFGNLQGTRFVLDTIKSHFRSGRILLTEGPTSMEADDVDALPIEVIKDLFTNLNGGALDPKDSQTAAQASNAPSNT